MESQSHLDAAATDQTTLTALHSAAATGSIFTLVDSAAKWTFWAKAKLALSLAAALVLTTVTVVVVTVKVGRESLSPEEVLDQAARNYAAMTSYSSTGTTVAEINGKNLTGTFSLRLGRTNRYRVYFEFRASAVTNQGVTWSIGNGDYFSNEVAKVASKIPTPRARRISETFRMSRAVPRSPCRHCSTGSPFPMTRVPQDGAAYSATWRRHGRL